VLWPVIQPEYDSNDPFVPHFVPFLEAELGVANDAAGISDIGRSAVRVPPAQLRIGSLKHGVRDPHVAVHAPCCRGVRMHGDGVNEEPRVFVSFVQILEMPHLLAAERSVPRKKADAGAVSMFTSGGVDKDHLIAVGHQRDALTAHHVG